MTSSPPAASSCSAAAAAARHGGCCYVAQPVLDTDYSVVSGVLPQRFAAIQALLAAQAASIAEGRDGPRLPFDSLICCNIGCPQSMGQPYIRYPRMVLSLLDSPFLIDHPNVEVLFPADVVARAKKYLCAMGGPTKSGAYTPPHGFAFVRKVVADYITRRDRAIVQRQAWEEASPIAEHLVDDVLMTDGASVGVRQIMQLVCGRFGYKPPARSPADFTPPDFVKASADAAVAAAAAVEDGILVPVPAYPLYTALLTLLGVQGMLYYLEESTGGWTLTPGSIERCLREYNAWVPEGSTIEEMPFPPKCRPRCLIVPNPGNPTGQVLSRDDMEAIIVICHRHKILLLADEVYQENIYQPVEFPFLSFRAVCLSMHRLPHVRDETSIVSIHSVSKGLLAECGRRGGYMALTNCSLTIRKELMKLNSINICPNISGQLLTALMLDPPLPGEESFASFQREMHSNFTSLQRKAVVIAEALNAIPGITCSIPPGAMYVFPKVQMPPRYITEHTKALNETQGVSYTPDTRWCLELLDEYGIVVIPGDGFLQEPGTFHFRTTILPSDGQLDRMISSIRSFHASVLERYS